MIVADVDEAVEARGGDPTGGRGANGNITGQLNREQEKKVMGSAV